VALTPCLASLERWQQDQVFVDLYEKIESSAWQLQIELEDAPSESELVLTLLGKAKYTAPKAENQPQELSSFLVKHDLAIVPFVLTPRNGWYSQVWARPDQNGAFNATFCLGTETLGIGDSYRIQVCAVKRDSLPVKAGYTIPSIVSSSAPQTCRRKA
jgi:hypothetical protein